MDNNVKYFRDLLGITQKQLAITSGVSRTTISNLERKKTVVLTNLKMKNISDALRRSVTEVFYSENVQRDVLETDTLKIS